MTVATFDTLKYANKLKAGGVPGPQAEAEAEALQVNLKDLVTKEDLKREINDLRHEMQLEFQKLDKRLDVASTKHSGEVLTLRLMFGAIMTGVIGILIRLFMYPPGHP